jgi:zinc protease
MTRINSRIALCAFIIIAISPITLLFGADDLRLPDVVGFSTSNGVTVYYVRDELPRITVAALVATGYLYETPEKAGITNLTAKTLTFGGTEDFPGTVLEEKVDSTGSLLSVSPDWESITVSYQALDEFCEDAFAVTGGLLTKPAVMQGHFDLAKHLEKEKIAREGEDPMMAAYLAARGLLFNKATYGIRPTVASVEACTLDDVVNNWKKSVHTGNLVIGIASSRPLSEIKVLAEKYFGKITKGERLHYTVDAAADRARARTLSGKVFFIKRDIPQSTVIILAPGADVHDPSADDLSVADQILGGGDFNSMLIKEIREKRGLAYGAGSIMRMRNNVGIFMAYAQCDSGKTPEVYALMKSAIVDIAGDKIVTEDVKLAKLSMVRSHIFAFDSELSVLSRYLSLWYTGFSVEYITGYAGRIEKTTEKSISAAFSRLIEDGYVTVILGREDSVKGINGVERIGE